MLFAVRAHTYLTSFFPLTVCLWKDFLSEGVYIPPHFSLPLCRGEWGCYKEYITCVCLTKGTDELVKVTASENVKMLREYREASGAGHRRSLCALVYSSLQSCVSGKEGLKGRSLALTWSWLCVLSLQGWAFRYFLGIETLGKNTAVSISIQ